MMLVMILIVGMLETDLETAHPTPTHTEKHQTQCICWIKMIILRLPLQIIYSIILGNDVMNVHAVAVKK